MSRRYPLLALALAGVATSAALASPGGDSGVIGPANRVQPSGRSLTPLGRLTPLGNHPGGGALTREGRFLWALSAGRGRNDIRIVDVDPALGCRAGRAGDGCRRTAASRAGRVIQTIPMPGVSGGIAMGPDGRTVYVSGVPDSAHADQKAPPGTPGLGGDVIHVFHYDSGSGVATRAGLIDVRAPDGAPTPQSFPPAPLAKRSWPRDLAVSPDGRTLLVALNLADHAAIVDTRGVRPPKYVAVGSFPYGAAITRDGKGLVSNESDGTVSVIDMAAARKLGDIQVGPRLSHPEGIAVDPTADRAYVAVAHQDLIAVIDTNAMAVERTLSVARPEGIGTEPTAVSVTGDGCRLMSADSGEDAVAVFALKPGCDTSRAAAGRSGRARRHKHKRHRRHARARRRRAPAFTARAHHRRVPAGRLQPSAATSAFALIGRVPVGSYPIFAGATPRREQLVWIAAKGVGVGPNPHGPNPLARDDTDDRINNYGYLPSIVSGLAGVTRFPTDSELLAGSASADAQLRPSNAAPPPAGTPISAPGPGQRIQHVFFIVKENRTYDQMLGDDPRGNGDPSLELFPSRLTPNAHALAQRFPLLDHVYANSEASIDGHFWTSAGAVSDYVVKNWHQNYAGRGRPYDFGVYSSTWPARRFLFDQARRQGISYFNYGEAIAGVVPVPDKDRSAEEMAGVLDRFAHSDLGEPGAPIGVATAPATSCYPNDSSIGQDSVTKQPVYDSALPLGASPTALSRVNCFRQRFGTQVAAGGVPSFNYMVLTNDHTNGLDAGQRTPQAMVADNDYALGQIVETISHSPIWGSSLIEVVEDDSQDGADHVDAHRIPALVISPFAKRGAVVHTRYDFPSFIRTFQIPIGMNPLNLSDALATPLYDAFDPSPSNSEPYGAIAPGIDLNERNPSTAANRRASRELNLIQPDRVSQRSLDRILWKSAHGAASKPPPPGPNAVGGG